MTNHNPSGLPATTKKVAAGSMFLFAACLFGLTNCGFDTSEGQYHYQVAEHIVVRGHLGFEQPMAGIFTTAPNGWTYASHEFGNSLLLIPTAAANSVVGHWLRSWGVSPERVTRFEQFVLSFQPVVYTALTLMFLYLMLVEEFGLTGHQAFTGCLLLATCTFFWTYSRNLFDGVLCGLLLTAALRYLFRFRHEGSVGDALLAFSLLGLAVDTRLSLALPTLAALGFVVLFCKDRKLQGLAAASVALAPFAAWQLWYNNLRTGNPLLSPVQTSQYATNNALDGDLGTGLVGLLFSPGKSLFVYAPFLLLSVVVFPVFWRKHRPAAAFILVVAVAWFLLHAKLRSWYGAAGWGPRQFVTILPLLALPALVSTPLLWARRWGRAVLVTTTAAGFVLTSASIIGNWHYRMSLRLRSKTQGDELFVWNFAKCQPIDMLAGTVNNVGVLLGRSEPDFLPEASDLNNYASNRINIWWYTLPRAGAPRMLVLGTASGLLLGLIFAGRKLTQRSAP